MSYELNGEKFKEWQKKNPEAERNRIEKIRKSNSHNRVTQIEIQCETCGRKILKYNSEIKNNKHNFCSQKCYLKSSIPTENILKRDNITHESRHYAFYFARKLYGDNCMNCGSEKNINVHHKDGNRRNNNPDNLRILCSSCHHRTDGRINNIPQEKIKLGIGGKIAYMKNKRIYESHRLPNGRFGGWS